jgi:hypothetical protein
VTEPTTTAVVRRTGIWRSPAVIAATSLVLAGLLAEGWWFGVRGDPLAERRADVAAAKGASVMPFDLAKTTHRFDKSATGGVQTVTANDPAHVAQLQLIRGHLREEAVKFSRGDFSDPAAIHGHEMPGLAELREGAARVDVQYQDLGNRAKLSYVTTEEPLIRGIHSWFAAQSADHG